MFVENQEWLNLFSRHDNGEWHANRFKVVLAAADLICLTSPKLEEILRPLGLPDESPGHRAGELLDAV